jgi:hypothetical protein
MGKFVLSKTMGWILGILTIVATIGYGLLFLLGASLGKALNSEMDHSGENQLIFVLFASFFILGIITWLGSLGLNRKGWRMVYYGFCLVLGFVLLASFFMAMGAVGRIYEGMILGISLLYFLLGFLVRNEK